MRQLKNVLFYTTMWEGKLHYRARIEWTIEGSTECSIGNRFESATDAANWLAANIADIGL